MSVLPSSAALMAPAISACQPFSADCPLSSAVWEPSPVWTDDTSEGGNSALVWDPSPSPEDAAGGTVCTWDKSALVSPEMLPGEVFSAQPASKAAAVKKISAIRFILPLLCPLRAGGRSYPRIILPHFQKSNCIFAYERRN